MNLEAVMTHLQDSAVGEEGKSLFITEMPYECKEGILLMDTYSGTKIDHELPGYYDTGYRFVVRSANYARGFALAKQASRVLTTQREMLMGGLTFKRSLPVNRPKPYRRSEAGVWEFEVDVECTYLEDD